MGLFLEAVAKESYATPGETIQLELDAINRSNVALQLKSVTLLPLAQEVPLNQDLTFNQ